jgi:hypothetical protein
MKTYQNPNQIPEGFVPLSALKFDSQSKNVLRSALYEGRIQGCGVQRSGYRYSQIWVNPVEAQSYLELSRKRTIRLEWEANRKAPNWFQRIWMRIACALAR